MTIPNLLQNFKPITLYGSIHPILAAALIHLQDDGIWQCLTSVDSWTLGLEFAKYQRSSQAKLPPFNLEVQQFFATLALDHSIILAGLTKIGFTMRNAIVNITFFTRLLPKGDCRA